MPPMLPARLGGRLYGLHYRELLRPDPSTTDPSPSEMSPKYKLTYFNAKGLAESVRFILSYMEEDFEDIRIEREQWPAMKASMPFGKLPVLEEDGKPLTQSLAIARYLGKKAGLAGKDDWEDVQIDIIADTITDMRMPVAGFFLEANEEVKKTKKDTYLNETLPFYLSKLDSVVEENGGYLSNNKLSWVDFVFASISEFISYVADTPDVTANYPHLKALRQTIFSLPQVAKWIAKRPNTQY